MHHSRIMLVAVVVCIFLFFVGVYYMLPVMGEAEFSKAFAHEGFRKGLSFIGYGLLAIFGVAWINWEVKGNDLRTDKGNTGE